MLYRNLTTKQRIARTHTFTYTVAHVAAILKGRLFRNVLGTVIKEHLKNFPSYRMELWSYPKAF